MEDELTDLHSSCRHILITPLGSYMSVSYMQVVFIYIDTPVAAEYSIGSESMDIVVLRVYGLLIFFSVTLTTRP